MSLFSLMRTDFADRRVYPGKCRSRGVESNSDPRNLPLPGTTTSASSGDQSRRGGDQVSATAPADAREALDMVRAGLGYLAAADAAQLPAATQAEVPARTGAARRDGDGGAGRVPGRVHRRAGARRGRGLQRGVLADPPDRDHPRRRGRAQRVGQAGRDPSAGDRGAGRGAGLRVRRAADLPVDRTSSPWSTGTRRTSSCWPRSPGGLGLADLASCSRRCTCGPGATCPTRTRAGSSRTGR